VPAVSVPGGTSRLRGEETDGLLIKQSEYADISRSGITPIHLRGRVNRFHNPLYHFSSRVIAAESGRVKACESPLQQTPAPAPGDSVEGHS
jgi:hypothetical protein